MEGGCRGGQMRLDPCRPETYGGSNLSIALGNACCKLTCMFSHQTKCTQLIDLVQIKICSANMHPSPHTSIVIHARGAAVPPVISISRRIGEHATVPVLP